MFKKITAFICMLATLIVCASPVMADNYENSAYKGRYLSAGATESNYGELIIHEIDEEKISVDFKFIKNGNQQLIYTCSPGTMNGDSGSLRFSVSYSNGQFVSNGTMKITLDDWCVRISCDSDQGQHLFDGMMKPEFDLNNNDNNTPENGNNDNPVEPPVTDEPIINGDVSVELNGTMIEFEEGIEPVIINDHTFVPLRSVFGKMGINVYWDQYKKNDILNAQTITCTKNDIIVQFSRTYNETGNNVWTLTKWVGENTSSKNFKRINITDLQPTIIENRSYIPLRVVSEAFDADVMWIHEERLVRIECDTYNEYWYNTDTISAIEDYSPEIADTYITDDFTNVIVDTTPYFSPQAKFYRYTASDTWSKVVLHVIYGGYIDVYPISSGTPRNDEVIPVPTPVEPPLEVMDNGDGNDVIPVTGAETESVTEAPAKTEITENANE